MLQLGEGHAISHEMPIQLEESTGTLSWLLDLMHNDIAQHAPLVALTVPEEHVLNLYRAAATYECGAIHQMLEGHLMWDVQPDAMR